MNLIHAIILGIVQGITEWFPISSSGHLVILEQIFKIKDNVMFDVFLHLGSLLVILLVFYKDIIKILKAFFKFDFKSRDGKFALYIILGSIATGLIGYFFKDLFMSFFNNLKVISIALLVTGGLLFLTQIKKRSRKLDFFGSILVGCAQGFALIPGISRSGATISTGLLSGVNRKEIAKFSFLLFIPAIIGALLFTDFNAAQLSSNWLLILIGSLCSVIVGYFSLKLLLKIIYNRKFHYFAYYCFVVGFILLIYSFV